MSTALKFPPRSLLLLWASVLAAPVAWSASLVILFWLTRSVCQGGARDSMLTVGLICVLVAVFAGVGAAAGRMLPLGNAPFSDFLLRVAVGLSAIFASVIALSLVPLYLLNPCRL